MSALQPEPDFDLAIIGAGFSGSMVALHALAAARGPLTVALINKHADFGRGIAYGTRCPSHLLNVPAGRMSAFVDDPDHFHRWLGAHAELCRAYGVDEARKDGFLPRALFGRYVSDLLAERERTAPAGAALKKIVADVTDLQGCPGGLRVWLGEGEQDSLTARKVVLAPGNFPPGDPPLRDRRFYRSDRYLSTPWKEENLDRLRRARSVLVLGSGLTAVDLVLTLRAEGQAERIHLLSRRDLLPQAHRPGLAPYPPFLADGQRPASIVELMRLVRAEVRRAAGQGVDWRPVLDALRPITPSLWQGLNLESQRRFLRHARVYWETHRHRVAPDLMAEVRSLIDAGTLVRHCGRVRTMEATAEGARVDYDEKSGGARRTVLVELVVNCTGPESNYRKLNDPLIINLLARGLIHPDRLFMGLNTAADGATISVEGNYSHALYTLGSARRGQLFESTAVPELRLQAQQLAQRLVRELQPPQPAKETAAFEI